MKHYICTGGCEGISDKPGICQDVSCPNHGQPLADCDCADGRHQPKIKTCKHCGKLCEDSCEVEPYKEELR